MADGGQQGTRSVLFTDLVGSTELRVRLGEEGADGLRRSHDTLLTDVVCANGGSVVKGLGDGIMAVFDSAVDAVSASIGIQQAVDVHSRREPELAFDVRVGVSIGDVSTEDDDVFGVPVVEASRLCAIANGGEILVAELVRALARGRGGFVFEPMGDLELKGLPDAVSTCRVTWEPIFDQGSSESGHAVPMPPPLSGGSATVYIGRGAMRERLADEWVQAQQGVPRTVLLAGEPGVGKTRTATELARRALSDGAIVLYGRCDEDLGMPYQPFVEALGHYVTHAATPQFGRLPGELSRLLPELPERVPDLPSPVSSDPASEEFRLFEATASWLMEAAAHDHGLLLVLDDIHWATKPTLQLMAHVVRSAQQEEAPLLIVATYRDTDIDRAHPLSAVLGDLRRQSGVDRVPVENLSHPEVVDLITRAAGHDLDAPTARLAGVIHAETEGNPFFVGEVLRHLIESGSIKREGERWVVADPDHIAVPEGVRDVVGRRLSRLSDTANEVMTVAAVMGRDFEVGVLLSLLETDEEASLDALDEAVRARLVEETSVDHFRFAHALVRTTLYEELSATRRRRLHRRVADVLEKMRPHDVRALAYHCTEGGPDGGDFDRAVRYTLAAAEEALAGKAYAEAEARFRSALEMLEEGEESQPASYVAALCGLGQSEVSQVKPEFRQTLFEASRRALELGRSDLLVRAVLTNTRGFISLVGGVDPERIEFIEAALEQIGPAPSPDRARLLARLAEEVTFRGDHVRRLALADEAEAMARAIGDDLLLCDVVASTGFSCYSAERPDELVARFGDVLPAADASGDPTRMVAIRVFLNAYKLAAGDLAGSAAGTREMVELAEREGSPHIAWIARWNAIRLLVMAGDLSEAETRNNDYLAVGQALGQPDGDPWWAGTQFGIVWTRGQLAGYAPLLADFSAQFPLTLSWQGAYAWALAEAGRLDEARAVIAAFDLSASRLMLDPWSYYPPFMMTSLAWLLDDAALAADALAVLLPYRTRWAHYYLILLGPVTWSLGLALATLRRFDEAVAELQDALAAVRRAELPTHIPKVEFDLAQVLLRRNGPGDAELATTHRDSARAAAVAYGMDGVVDAIDSLIP